MEKRGHTTLKKTEQAEMERERESLRPPSVLGLSGRVSPERWGALWAGEP